MDIAAIVLGVDRKPKNTCKPMALQEAIDFARKHGAL